MRVVVKLRSLAYTFPKAHRAHLRFAVCGLAITAMLRGALLQDISCKLANKVCQASARMGARGKFLSAFSASHHMTHEERAISLMTRKAIDAHFPYDAGLMKPYYVRFPLADLSEDFAKMP